MRYIDLHTHTRVSDGFYPPAELVRRAQAAGIGVLAITDHNTLVDLEPLRAEFPGMKLIQGCEVSCRYRDAAGREWELHVVGLGVDPENGELRRVLRQNQPDRAPYINAILGRLRDCGRDTGTYEELRAKNPDTKHLGRMSIAKEMQHRGHVQSVDEAFDVYLGAFGQRLAYVENPLKYVSLEEAVAAIRAAGGIAVLAHLFYYQMEREQGEELVRYFKSLAGPDGGMEVWYGRYDGAQRAYLRALARENDLMFSAASDFHGQDEGETLEHHFELELCEDILKRLGY